MAGIGFSLRGLLGRQTYFGLLQAYAYAGIIAAGPWLVSIVGILAIGLLAVPLGRGTQNVAEFQTSLTWLIASSLVVTGPIQLGFTRYIADLLYARRDDEVLGNLNGALCVVTAAAGGIGLAALGLFFRETPLGYRALMLAAFVLLCDVWVATLLMSALKRYHPVVALYAAGYGVTVAAALFLGEHGVEGLLAGFVAGQLLLLAGMLYIVQRAFPAGKPIAFGFARRGAMFPVLLGVGLAFNLALWTDKLLFWFSPATGEQVIGPLRSSVVYDLPVFLAYLSILPGMAVFLVRLETDFVDACRRFYDAAREGAQLAALELARDDMVECVRRGLFDIVKVQSIAALLVFVWGAQLLEWAGISTLHAPLLMVQVVGAGLQVVLLGQLNVFFYLDKRGTVLAITLALLALNTGLTWATLVIGPPFYGYGFTLAMLASVLLGFVLLDRKLERLEFETFMLQ